MKKLVIVIIILFTGINYTQQENLMSLKKIRIGIVVDGFWDRNKDVIELLKKEVNDALAQQAEIIFPSDKILVGDWTNATASRLNEKLIQDKDIDIVVGFGLMTSSDLAKRTNLPKPVIAPIIVDPMHKEFPYKDGASGIKNLSYITFPGTYERDLSLLKDFVPYKKLAWLQSERYHKNLPYLEVSDESFMKMTGINIKSIHFDNNAEDALKQIPDDVDAVYVDVLPLSKEEYLKLTKGLIEKRLPSFSFLGEYDVRQGIMAGANPDIFPRIVRRIALHIQRIVSGEDAGTLNVNFGAAKRLFINLKTAYAVGISPKWSTLMEAELVEIDSAKIKDAQVFNLPLVIKRIANENLDVQAKIQEIAAERENIAIARANLFPKLDFNSTGLMIDKDRAEAGYQPEKRGTFDLSLTQVIFSEPALANLSIRSSLYDSKSDELEAFKQTTISDGTKLYLNYLRAKRMFYIILDNLKLLRSNLEIAQNRQEIGAAGPEEPLRWEAEIADLRKTAMEVQSQMNQAYIALKQVLNIPLIYQINVEDVSLGDTTVILTNKKLLSYLEDPVSFEILTDFIVNRGMLLSKELQQINSLIEAQERSLTSVRYSLFTPTIAAFGGYTRTFYKSTVKQPFQLTSIPPTPPDISPNLPLYLGQLFAGASPKLPDNNDWQIGVQLSLNISNGFATKALEQQTSYQLEQLKIQKRSAEEKIALRIRYEMENLKATHFGIQQSQIEVEAANKTLHLVSDAYSRGALSILNLIDAQASSLRSKQVSANALYDFYIAYIQLQRAVGQFDALMTATEKKEFMDALDNFRNKSKK
jgi:outer membrane protein